MLVAIDDVQWVDTSSKSVIAFVPRRLDQRIGLLIAERSGPDTSEPTASWLQLGRDNGIERIRLGPLSLGGLHTLISNRLGHPLTRPAMVRITETSHGNPFYALELARAASTQSPTAEPVLPGTLAELMRDRIGHLERGVGDVLLAAACVADPTVDLLAEANGTTAAHTVELLEPVEDKGIIGINGNRVRFSHPLLARGVYADASPRPPTTASP